MWIRSQDKELLIKVKEVYISNNSLKNLWLKELYKKETLILNYLIQTDMTALGTYSTKEKAMKVLDMIQERLFYIERFGAHHTNEIVFQMPQDEEVEV